MEEIDVPGEYFIDKNAQKLYFYPVSDEPQECEYAISKNSNNLLLLNDVEYVTFNDIAFTYNRNDMIKATGNDITFDGCRINGCGTNGLILDGKNIVIENCHISNIGRDGIRLNGPAEDRITLIPSGSKITNNRIHAAAIGAYSNGYGIKTQGVATEITNNEIYDMGGIAIRPGNANDTLIKDNEIYNSVKYTSDNGAIYWGRQIASMGISVIHNYIHDIRNKYGGYGFQGVFVDDYNAGALVKNNIFYNSGTQAVKNHGGAYSNIENNIILETKTAYYLQKNGQAKALLYSFDLWPGTVGTQWGSWNNPGGCGDVYLRLENWKEHYKGTQWEYIFDDYSPAKFDTINALDKFNSDNQEFRNSALYKKAEELAPLNERDTVTVRIIFLRQVIRQRQCLKITEQISSLQMKDLKLFVRL